MISARANGCRLAAVLVLVAAAVALGVAPVPAAAATPSCSAVLFAPVEESGAYRVEQPETVSGAIFCQATVGGLEFDLAVAPGHGTVAELTPNGLGGATFTYTPTPGFAGVDGFSLSARELSGQPDIVPVAVSVRPATDDPPVCAAQLTSTEEGGSYGVRAGTPVHGTIDCFDDGGAELTFAVQSAPAHGTLSEIEPEGDASARFTYTPAPGYEGGDTFALVADDGTQDSTPAMVDVKIGPAVDEPPHCTGTLATTSDASAIFEVQQGKPVHGAVTCVDEDDAGLDFAVGSAPGHGVLAPLSPAGDGSADLTYTPAPGYLGFDSFRVDVSDGANPPTQVTVQLRVVPAHADPPACTAYLLAPVESGAYRVKQGATVEGQLDCEGDDGDPLTYAVASAPQHGSVTAVGEDGSFSYTASGSYVGADELSLVADDGSQESVPVGLDIAVVAAANEPPNCQVTLGAGADDAGAYLVDRDTAVEGQIVCSDDTDPDPTPAVAAAPAHGRLSTLEPDGPGRADFTYTPAPAYLGADAFTLSVDDGEVAPTTTTVVVDVVEPGPDVPHCSARLDTTTGPDGYEVESGETVSGTLTCFDPDGSDLSFSLARASDHGAVAELEPAFAGADFTYRAAAGWTGADGFALVASNGQQSSNVVDVEIAVVTPVDDPPVCAISLFSERMESGAYPAEEGEDNPGVVACVDDEGEPLTFAVTQPPQHGAIENLEDDGESAMFDYRSDVGHLGPDAVTVGVHDTAGGQDLVTLDLDVGPSTDTAPVCTATLEAPLAAGSYTVEAGVATTGHLNCRDAEDDPLSFAVVQPPSHGTLGPLTGTGDSRSFAYTPGAEARGSDSFIFKGDDGRRESAPVAIAVLIQGPAPTPPDQNPGTGSNTPASPPSSGGGSPSSTSPGPQAGKAKPLKCRKGFTKKTMHGKARCVKKPKRKRAKKHQH